MGRLSIIATPIGNLADISFRAIDALRTANIIFCEDTRVTKKLLNHYSITTSLSSYHSFSSFGKIRKALRLLQEGKHIALVSDAGTPGVSDPGVRFVRAVRTESKGTLIESIPGASALTTALAASGAPSSSFVFLGFLPHKKGRQSLIESIATEPRTVVVYESPHRLLKTLEALQLVLKPNREVIVAREITKKFESYIVGTASEVYEYYQQHQDEVRGECVVIVSSLEKRV